VENAKQKNRGVTMKGNMYYAVRHYLERVLGVLNVNLCDGPFMGVELEPKSRLLKLVKGKYQITLPLTEDSVIALWGVRTSGELQDELWWTILVASLFHELGHIISGEPIELSKFRRLMSNLVNDANENNVIPAEWFGATRYLQISNEFATALHGDLKDLPDGTVKERYQLLVRMAAIYRPMLGIVFGGGVIRELPDDHPLHDTFEDIKKVMHDCRRLFSPNRHTFFQQRSTLTNDLAAIFRKWYEEEKKNLVQGQSIPTLEEMSRGVGPGEPLQRWAGGDGKLSPEELKSIVGQAADKLAKSKIKEEFESSQASARYDQLREERQSEEELCRAVTKLDKRLNIEQYIPEDENDGGHGYTSIPPASNHTGIALPNKSAAFKLRLYFNRLMFARAYKGRYIDVEGRKLHAPNFYQVKTMPLEKARIMQNITGVKTAISRTHAVFMFDRSGSMAGSRSAICKKIMATFHKAIATIPELRLDMFGFGCEVYPIRNGKRDIYAEIDRALSADGGTNLPLAYRVGLKMLEHNQAERKLLVILTDGDTSGSYNIRDLKQMAERQKVQVICIVIGGGGMYERAAFDNLVSVDNITKLPQEFSRVVLRRF